VRFPVQIIHRVVSYRIVSYVCVEDAERESIELQDNLDGIKNEKERLLNSLIEAERQIMLWEKKTQLAKETKEAVDADVGQGEMAVSLNVYSPTPRILEGRNV